MTRPIAAPRRRVVRVASPAAGAEWTRVNDSGRLWWVYAVVFRLTTDANVATRVTGVIARQGDDVWFGSSCAQTQAAGLTRRIGAYNGASAADSSASVNRMGWPADGLWLPPGERLESSTSGLQAGDQYSEIVLAVVELDESVVYVPGQGWPPYAARESE